MQARAGAMDELLQSGVLEDVGGDTDDIQEELDEAASAADVDSQLAALKVKLAAPPATPELPSAIHRQPAALRNDLPLGRAPTRAGPSHCLHRADCEPLGGEAVLPASALP